MRHRGLGPRAKIVEQLALGPLTVGDHKLLDAVMGPPTAAGYRRWVAVPHGDGVTGCERVGPLKLLILPELSLDRGRP